MYILFVILSLIIVISLISYNKEDFRRHRLPRRRPGSPRRRPGSPRRRPGSPRRRHGWRRNRGWGWNVWQYLYPYSGYPNYYVPENPGCDGKACGGYCNPYNSKCCGGTSPSTCGLGYCSNSSLCN